MQISHILRQTFPILPVPTTATRAKSLRTVLRMLLDAKPLAIARMKGVEANIINIMNS